MDKFEEEVRRGGTTTRYFITPSGALFGEETLDRSRNWATFLTNSPPREGKLTETGSVIDPATVPLQNRGISERRSDLTRE